MPELGFEEAVDGVLAQGARAIVAITAGLGESGDEGRARQDALIRRVRDAGAVLVGPNCLGLVDNHTATYLSSNTFRAGRRRAAQPERQPGHRGGPPVR